MHSIAWSLKTTVCVRSGCSFSHISFSCAAETGRQVAFLLPRSLQFQLSLLGLCSYHRLWLKTEIFYKTRVSGCLTHFLCLSLPFVYISRPQKFHEAGELKTSLSLLIYKWKRGGSLLTPNGTFCHPQLCLHSSGFTPPCSHALLRWFFSFFKNPSFLLEKCVL